MRLLDIMYPALDKHNDLSTLANPPPTQPSAPAHNELTYALLATLRKKLVLLQMALLDDN